MTDREFENAFSAAGGSFLLLYGETVMDWTGNPEELAEFLYEKGHDRNLSGTRARIAAIRRLLQGGRFADALKRVQNSARINRLLPGADVCAGDFLRRRFSGR